MSKANSFTPIEGSHFLYFCDGNAWKEEECANAFDCEFFDGTCNRTTRIEYAKNKNKYKKQIVDGTFPHIEDWIEEGGNYIERG